MRGLLSIAFLVTLFLTPACGPSVPYSEDQPDPAEVDAKHYKVEFENDLVRVLRVEYGPGEESVMHYHPDHVAVVLTDFHGEFQGPDGTKQELRLSARQQVWAPAGSHLPRNAGSSPFEAILVELKPGAYPDTGRMGPDPILVDAAQYNAEEENEHVRILRIRYPEGHSSIPHWHPDSVAVFLTDHHAEFVDDEGNTEQARFRAGEHRFMPAGNHTPTNTGDASFEVLLVELK